MKSTRLPVLMISIFVVILGSTNIVSPSKAEPGATFQVNANTDVVDALPGDGICETATGNGMCTLRAAIMEANAHIGADTINLPTATYHLTIQGATEEACATGDLNISESLTIIGDPSYAIIDATGLGDRVLQILPSAFKVSISYVTIKNGNTTQHGGGIWSMAELELNNVVLSDNHASDGGGINSNAPLTITNASITDNSAGEGGGIISFNTVSMKDVAIVDNSTSLYHGGGLSIHQTSASMANVLFYANTAKLDGGGIYNLRSNLTIMDSTFQDNNSGDFGGGIYNSTGAEVYMDKDQFVNNTAFLSGGGIYNDNGSIIGQNVSFTQNHSSAGPGGAIASSGYGYFEHSIYSSNTAGGGGAISNLSNGNFNLVDSEVISNTAGNGGGLTNSFNMMLQHVSVSRNSGYYSGGIRNFEHLEIVSSTINGNSSSDGAGGIYNSGELYVTNSTISGNVSENYYGGGIYSTELAVVTNSTITNNMAGSSGIMAYGGGVYATTGSSFTLRNTILYGNHHKELIWKIEDDCYGNITTQHYNLVGTLANCLLVGSQGLDKIGKNPLLGGLSDNGGNILTHALLDGSPAIDAADPNGCQSYDGSDLIYDQRGYLRYWDGNGDGVARCDIGAYEYGSRMLFFLPVTFK